LSDEETNGPLIADDPATSARSRTGRKIASGEPRAMPATSGWFPWLLF